MTRFKALVGLNMSCDVGSARLKKLLEVFGTPENILKEPAERLSMVFGIGDKVAGKVASLKEADIDAEIAFAEKSKLKIITIDDPAYPANLKYIPDPPILLYVKGELEEEDRLSIAIVGSRRASFYGLSCARKFAEDLSAGGFTIVSGLARGVDTASHQGALKAGGRTIAVIGSGFNHIYPPENKKLADQVSVHGAVISEFPMNTSPLAHNFPRRNRIISGLSLGVLVVEAARNSGALITVDCALEQGRDVFALPGKIDSGTSFGTNEIIKQGAKLVSCADDIIDEFGLPKVTPKAEGNTEVSEEEAALYNLIQDEPLALDDIVERSGLDITKISGVLLNLQLRRLVKEVPGKQFIRMNA
ncbi:MAG: DNA-processing protein DprA [Candidatus Omnitrophota bacterium]|jgi:DNA processing protein